MAGGKKGDLGGTNYTTGARVPFFGGEGRRVWWGRDTGKAADEDVAWVWVWPSKRSPHAGFWQNELIRFITLRTGGTHPAGEE